MKTLKEACKGAFRIGAALGPVGKLSEDYTPQELALIAEQFDTATPENCMKPKEVIPTEGQWRFELGDEFMQFCQENHLTVIGHVLLWHAMNPAWLFKEGKKPVSRRAALARMHKYIRKMVGRYQGKILGWDVVNDAISDRAHEYLRPTPWFQAVGEDYIEMAFRFARQTDPDVELYYNDYNIESEPTFSKTMRLLHTLQRRDVPLDGIAIQGHWLLDRVPFADIERAIVGFSELGIQVMFSELDLDVLPGSSPMNAPTSGRELDQLPLVSEDHSAILARQADQYARLFELFLKYRKVVSRVGFWGTTDEHSWLNYWPTKRENHPLLFDRQLKPKPAFEAILKVMTGK